MATLSPLVERTVAPGDVVLDLTKGCSVLRLGGGLRQDGDSIVVTRAGRLRHTKPSKYWVEGSQKRYVPNVEDGVIGVIADCREAFSVDIAAPTSASLPRLAFEGATRRNAPNLQAGALVYARVVKSHRDINPELSCMDASGKSAGFGPLKGGYLFECSTGLARALLSKPTCPVLEALGKSLTYEIAVGLNGRVWIFEGQVWKPITYYTEIVARFMFWTGYPVVNADSVPTIVAVSNAISSVEFLSPAQQHILVQRIIESMKH